MYVSLPHTTPSGPLQAEDAKIRVLEMAPPTAHSMALENEASGCSKPSRLSPSFSGAPFLCQILEISEAATQEKPYFQGHLGRALGQSRLPEPLARKEHGMRGVRGRYGEEGRIQWLHTPPLPCPRCGHAQSHQHIPFFVSSFAPPPRHQSPARRGVTGPCPGPGHAPWKQLQFWV